MIAEHSSFPTSEHHVTPLKGMTVDDLKKWMESDEAREKSEKWAEDFAIKHPEPIEQVPYHDYSSYQPPPELSRIQTASGAGDLATVRKILQEWKGGQDCFGTALQPALEGGHLAVAECLLEYGNTVNSGHFRTAMQHKSYPFLDLYLRHGYNINDTEGTSRPSPLADTLDDEEMVRWFLEHGADPNAERIIEGGRMGETPLSRAMWRAPLSTIQLLFDHGGPVRDSIQQGSLLWYGVERELPDRLQLLTYLLNNGAASDLTKLMFHNRPEPARQADWVVGRGTPLHAAAENGDLDVVKLFIVWGADPTIEDSKGRLAIDQARKQLELRGDGKFQGVIDYLSAISNPAAALPSGFGPTGLERL
ncbi:MAG: hypothetical protein Q9207_005198 [Kuettlingeria erythrocarpa]